MLVITQYKFLVTILASRRVTRKHRRWNTIADLLNIGRLAYNESPSFQLA
jgi:hypothetical protein